MIQIKEKKMKYRNTIKKLKATFCGRGFRLDSKSIGKSKNLTVKIIQQNNNIRPDFLGKDEKAEGILRRRKYEYK